MARVVVVVPCYNEAARLPREAFEGFRLPGHELSFLFVDDGSTDATGALLTAMVEGNPSFDMLALEQNSGKGEAVRQGMLRAVSEGADFVAFWDADLATPLLELSRFVPRLAEDPARLVVMGARVRLLGREIERRFYRHVYGRAFATAVSRMLALSVYDTQCGAKLFRAGPELDHVLAEPFLSRWIFDVEILARLVAVTADATPDLSERIFEVPLRVWKDVAGSKVRTTDALRAVQQLAQIGLRYRAALSARHSGS
ncbi:MAG: glycosyltransferase [Deltaproteobacteria bacterium]|nr:glycosyltransferase [Deltaproteobacteria bacterium]